MYPNDLSFISIFNRKTSLFGLISIKKYNNREQFQAHYPKNVTLFIDVPKLFIIYFNLRQKSQSIWVDTHKYMRKRKERAFFCECLNLNLQHKSQSIWVDTHKYIRKRTERALFLRVFKSQFSTKKAKLFGSISTNICVKEKKGPFFCEYLKKKFSL